MDLPWFAGSFSSTAVISLVKVSQITERLSKSISSGAALEDERKQAIESASKGFVSKPFRSREMLKTIREVLDAD